MGKQLLVFDSHPVQYRVPIWQAIEKERPGFVHVIYGSDCSMRGQFDPGFGRAVAWNEPMLSGYDHTILNCEKGVPLADWGSLTGEGVNEVLAKFNPCAVLLTGLNYRYDWVTYLAAKGRGIPVWLRCETQDVAFQRSRFKTALRSLAYRIAYVGFTGFFYIGELNKRHYLTHGVSPSKLHPALYTTLDRFATLNVSQKLALRNATRVAANVHSHQFVVGFSGKLIPKKNPQILFDMVAYLPEALRSRLTLYFIGSGELDSSLHECAKLVRSKFGVHSVFVGFVNQADIAGHYLALDMLVLPSRQRGETWGLVANEAMQAGCSVTVSNYVGCGADFQSWSRFSIFPSESPQELANIVSQFAQLERSFDWAKEQLLTYSIAENVQSILSVLT